MIRISVYHKILRNIFVIFTNIGLLLSITLSVYAEDDNGTFPVQSRGNLWFTSDILQYQDQNNRTRIEILYTVNLDKFWNEFQTSDSLLLGVTCRISDKENNLLSETARKKRFYLKSQSTEQELTYIDVIRYSLVPDLYRIEITMQDTVTGAKGISEHLLQVRRFSEKFSLSDINFIAYIQKTDNKGSFEKNGYLFIPNIQRKYLNTGKDKLFIYYEINNLSFITEEQTYYHTYYSILDLREKEVLSDSREWQLASASDVAEIEKIDVRDLQPGIYKLIIKVIDVKSDKLKTESAYFQISAPLQQYTTLLPMTEEDIEKYIKQIRYIATDKEIKIFKQLNNQAKQNFLLNFWKSKDTDPTTDENEFMEEHFNRIAYTQAHIKGGIESDMGRIYIIYGPPQDIERNYSQMKSSKPVITWYYALEGSIKFIFVDRTGDGIYSLVHSTKLDGYNDPDWQEHIIENN